MDSLNRNEVSKLIKNTGHLHKALLANGYFLPPLKSAFVTQKFLLEVFDERCYCPHLKDVTFMPCVNPPTAEYLLDTIVTMIEQNGSYNEGQALAYNRLAHHMSRNRPEKQWLLALLATLNSGHEVFQKGFKPP